MTLATNKDIIMKCPYNHIDTYKVPLHELHSFWKKGWIPNEVYLMGCNTCEDFYPIDRYDFYTSNDI